jgi:hypothetical protein
MYKALCVAAIIAGVLALTGRSSNAAPAPFSSPMIVAKGRLVDQTAPIPSTTIFTPNQTGLYRLSVYATIVTANPSSASAWEYNVNWTDDGGLQSLNSLLYAFDNQTGSFLQLANVFPLHLGGPVTAFQVKAGHPITYSVTQGGPPDKSAYSLFWTLERLE